MNSNTLEFFVKMRDMFSSPMSKLAQGSHKTFMRMNADVEGVIKKNYTLAASYDKINAALKRAVETEKRSNSFSGMSGANRLMGMAGVGLSAGAAISFAKSSISSAMNYGATSKSFEVLTGSASEGKTLADNLNKLQQSTILGPEVFKSAQTLMSFGVTGEKVIAIEKMLGDVSMGNKDKFESLTLAFSQTQSAGRLMGQDLLQYINAGFNPLKEISDMTGVSMAVLKKRMEDGSISADMVTKAFEHATSEGGKFNNMMGTIAETSYGKMQILEGQFENFKIQVGNSLMPLAEELMGAGNNLLTFLNIAESESSKLIGQNAGMNVLVDTITHLNEKNEIRKSLIGDLIKQYPEFFGNIDSETVKNSNLLDILDKVNVAYGQKLKLQTNIEFQDADKSEFQKLSEQQSNYLKIAYLLENNHKEEAHAKMPFNDGNGIIGMFRHNDPSYWKDMAAPITDQLKTLKTTIDNREQENKTLETTVKHQEIIDKAMQMYNDGSFAKQITKSGDQSFFLDAVNAFQNSGLSANSLQTGNPFWHTDFDKLNKIITPSMATKDGGLNDTKNQDNVKSMSPINDFGKSVASGGPRVININGVKFTDKIEIHVDGMQAGIDKTQEKLEDMFLRLLNSGARVQ
ncbi:MAG: tape measure protein [Panacibacter sp.]